MRRFGASLLVVLVASVSGCVLPIPNRSIREFGVRGKVVDYVSESPIAGALVLDGLDFSRRCTTDEEGVFYLPPVRQWHGGFLIGVALNYPIWPCGGLPRPQRSVVVRAPAYEEKRLFVTQRYVGLAALRRVPHGFKLWPCEPTRRGPLDAGILELSPRSPR